MNMAETGLMLIGVTIGPGDAYIDEYIVLLGDNEHRFKIERSLTGSIVNAEFYSFSEPLFIPDGVPFKTRVHVVKPGKLLIAPIFKRIATTKGVYEVV